MSHNQHKYLYTFFTTLCLFIFTNLTAQTFVFKSFPLTDNNTRPSINCIYKISNGYIYAGTTNGLYKFDGEKFFPVLFKNPDFRDTVTAIFEDNNKLLWIGFQNGRIANLIKGKLEYYNPEEGTPTHKITSFIEDTQKNLWFASYGEGLYVLSKGRLYLFDSNDGLTDLNINGLESTREGEVILATDQGIQICSFIDQKKKVDYVGSKEGLTDLLVTSIKKIFDNLFCIGTESGALFSYDLLHKKINPIHPKGIETGQVNDILVLSGKIWLATNAGLISLDKTTGDSEFNNNQKNISHLINDDQGNIWYTTGSHELFRTMVHLVKVFPYTAENSFSNIHAILPASNNLFYTNAKKGLYKYDLKSIEKKPFFIPITSLDYITPITALYEDKNHNIWIGTMGKGIIIYNPGTGEQRTFNENPVFKNANVLSLKGNADAIFATSLEGITMINLATNQNIAKSYSFTNISSHKTGTGYIYTVYKDKKDRYWFATDGMGVSYMQDGNFTHLDQKEVANEHVFAITEDIQGNIWFSTDAAGIFKFDGKNITNYNLQNGLSNLDISGLITDKHGNILSIQSTGIDVFQKASDVISYISTTHGIGEVNTDMGAYAQDNSGNIWICTNKGFARISPPETVNQQPRTILESVQLFLQDISFENKTVFNHDENNFTFSYNGLYYTDPSLVSFQYMLQGLDTAWITTTDHSKTFPKLQPGNYTFRVRSSIHKNFNEANEASFSFTIKQAFYKTWWFVTLVIVFLLGIVYLFFQWRENNYKKIQELRNEKLRSQFELLRNQVNPHFLFNNFNTLISYIEEDPAAAVKYTEQLSDFFRNMVNYRDKEVISLREELEVLNTYFYLQKQRHGSSIELRTSIATNVVASYFIPPLTLQLLVENAIKHNTIGKDNPLIIKIILENDYLIITNNKISRVSAQAGTGMGLVNIINRFTLLITKRVEVIEDENNFTVSLPLIKKQYD